MERAKRIEIYSSVLFYVKNVSMSFTPVKAYLAVKPIHIKVTRTKQVNPGFETSGTITYNLTV
jgi:hypothetical protein